MRGIEAIKAIVAGLWWRILTCCRLQGCVVFVVKDVGIRMQGLGFRSGCSEEMVIFGS